MKFLLLFCSCWNDEIELRRHIILISILLAIENIFEQTNSINP